MKPEGRRLFCHNLLLYSAKQMSMEVAAISAKPCSGWDQWEQPEPLLGVAAKGAECSRSLTTNPQVRESFFHRNSSSEQDPSEAANTFLLPFLSSYTGIGEGERAAMK